MAYLQIGDQQFLLRVGAQRIAPDAAAEIPIPGAEASASAVVEVGPGPQVIIRRASTDSVLSVNGIVLGPEPAPLMHGDRVQIGGRELRFGDTEQSGSTQFISSGAVADVIRARAGLPARPTRATGGRLVSLVDGREYAIPPIGIVIGRDPASDVVIASGEVSRRHVSIAPAESGYILTDLSTNGVWVNGERVVKEQTLGRGDIVKVAAEEFRFYADAVKPAAKPPEAVAPPPPSVSPAPLSGGPSAAIAAPVAPPKEESVLARSVLAVLEVLNEGPSKGTRLDVTLPLTHIGRGDHNDLVLPSSSVSDSHAKLQLRESGWVVVDLGSTNGTYVAGRRISGEQPLSGAPDLRFGDIKVSFTPVVEPEGAAKSTQVITGATLEASRRSANRAQEPRVSRTPVRASTPRTPPPASTGVARWVYLVLVIAAAVVFWLLTRGA